MVITETVIDWSWSNGSTITIISGNAPTGYNQLGEQIFTTTVSYDGPANLFDESGSVINDMLGAIASEVLSVIIDGTAPYVNGLPTLPQGISVGDTLQINDDPNVNSWLIQYAHYWDTYPYCLKLSCNLAKGG